MATCPSANIPLQPIQEDPANNDTGNPPTSTRAGTKSTKLFSRSSSQVTQERKPGDEYWTASIFKVGDDVRQVLMVVLVVMVLLLVMVVMVVLLLVWVLVGFMLLLVK